MQSSSSSRQGGAPANSCQKPTRPGFGPALKRLVNFLAARRHAGRRRLGL